MAKNRSSAGLFAKVIPIIFLVAMMWLVVSTVSFAFKLFYSYLAIPLLIIALFLNYSVVTDHINSLMRGIKEDAGKGLIKLVGNVVFYPFVFAFLAMKAWGKRALGSKRPSVKEQKGKDGKKGEYIKYEEVEKEDFLELEDIDKPKPKVKVKQSRETGNDYDDLFA